MASPAVPLVARSTDGSLVGIHPRTSGLIRCYDGNVSNGSLKFTLRLPTSSPTSPEGAAADGEGGGVKDEAVRKLVFASSTVSSMGNESPTHLCGMKSTTILLWDLDRGVLAHTVNVRAPPKKKKKRQSSIGGGNEVVCDVAAGHGQLYVLVLIPSSSGDDGHAGKCRIYQYDLSSTDVALKRKIKVGSVPVAADEDGAAPPLFGLAVSRTTVAVRLGTQLRVLDASSGEKLCKLDLPAATAPTATQSEGNESFAPLEMTPDGAYLAVGTNNHAVVLSHKTDDDGGTHALRPLALLSATDDAPLAALDLTLDDVDHIDLSVVAFQPTLGVASLYAVATSHAPAVPLVPQLPQATLRTTESDKSLSFVDAGFHPRNPNEALRLLFQRAGSKSGSAAGGGTILPMEVVKYADDDGLDGTVVVGTTLVDEEDDAKKREGRKRKAASGVALAPGEMGREATGAVDLTSKKAKKARGEDVEGEEAMDDEEFVLDDDEEGEPGQSIAERLALLSSAMEQTDEEDDDDEDDEGSSPTDDRPSKFKLKSATSETLTTLLSQALTSNDAQQLHVALQVTDRRLVESTVAALQSLDAARQDGDDAAGPALLPALLAHIVRRMARRHSLVLPLGAWVRAILAATARGTLGRASAGGGPGAEERMAREGREMASKLGPLRNLLNERVECFPQLLRLEGRLALLNQQL